MSTRSFVQEIAYRNRELGLRLCIGLDVNAAKAKAVIGGPNDEDSVVKFNQEVGAATKHVALVYKPNLWFYLSQGPAGVSALIRTVAFIHEQGMRANVDAKFGDIGTTSKEAAEFLFRVLQADAITANPYMGRDALEPVLAYAERGVICICKTSNPGSAEFQDRQVTLGVEELEKLYSGPARQTPFTVSTPGATISTTMTMWQLVALQVSHHWDTNNNCGLVVGATFPGHLAMVRKSVGSDLPILIPGVGKQGGDLAASVKAGVGPEGNGVIALNVSSAVTGASDGSDFAEAAGRKAEQLHWGIQAAVAELRVEAATEEAR